MKTKTQSQIIEEKIQLIVDKYVKPDQVEIRNKFGGKNILSLKIEGNPKDLILEIKQSMREAIEAVPLLSQKDIAGAVKSAVDAHGFNKEHLGSIAKRIYTQLKANRKSNIKKFKGDV